MASYSATPVSSQLDHFVLRGIESTNTQLGKGAYGRVFEVRYAGTSCAAKEMHEVFFRVADRDELARVRRNFLEECRIWGTLRHPNIVQFMGVWYRNGDESGIPVIIMEKMQCSLRYFIERHKTEEVSHFKIKLPILHDVCKGLWYLHIQKPPIVHRDLSPNNILLGSQYNTAKITDLGEAKVMNDTDSGRKMTKAPGTPHFMPPETRLDNPKYGPPLDIFSFAGVVLFTITHQWPEPTAREKKNPDGGKKEVAMVLEVDRRHEYLDKMVGKAAGLKPLVRSCLNDHPDERPLIAEVTWTIKNLMDVGMDGDQSSELTDGSSTPLEAHLKVSS